MTVHYFNHGMSACMRQGPPVNWPPDHRWSSDWKDVTCDECLLGKDEIKTYLLSGDGRAITCLRCKRTSYNPSDVRAHYCSACETWHDDLWPPARLWWIKSYGKKEN